MLLSAAISKGVQLVHVVAAQIIQVWSKEVGNNRSIMLSLYSDRKTNVIYNKKKFDHLKSTHLIVYWNALANTNTI